MLHHACRRNVDPSEMEKRERLFFVRNSHHRYMLRGDAPAGEESQEDQPAADSENGAAEKSRSDALEAFLDSAPDPFRARQPSINKARLLVCPFRIRGLPCAFTADCGHTRGGGHLPCQMVIMHHGF